MLIDCKLNWVGRGLSNAVCYLRLRPWHANALPSRFRRSPSSSCCCFRPEGPCSLSPGQRPGFEGNRGFCGLKGRAHWRFESGPSGHEVFCSVWLPGRWPGLREHGPSGRKTKTSLKSRYIKPGRSFSRWCLTPGSTERVSTVLAAAWRLYGVHRAAVAARMSVSGENREGVIVLPFGRD